MTKEKDSSTPLMRQYWEIKTAHTDKILFFRMGDFFEMFFDDAVTAAPILGIALTSRNKKAQDETPMCGIPHHSVAGPINKLLSQGYKVAICDQIEDPKQAKGIVKRAVTRILTPGMVFDNETLEATESHFMACWEKGTLAFIEPTTGDAFYFKSNHSRSARRLLQVLPVAELVVAPEEVDEWRQPALTISLSTHENLLTEGNEPAACSRLRSYIKSLGGEETLSVLKPFEKREWQHRLEISPTTLRHLEIFATYKGESRGSLYRAINRTQTAPGGRLLRQWLAFPLRDQNGIEERLSQVQSWKADLIQLKGLRQHLAQIGDIERRLSRMVTPQSHARDLISLAQATQGALAALGMARGVWKGSLKETWWTQYEEQSQRILRTFREDAPLSTKQGHMIQEGVSSELDEMIRLTRDSQSLLAEMEAREKAATGISSLKIRYNNVFGYYIEVTNTHKDKVPSHYQRKQTLTNAERYCTEELVDLERKVLAAQTKRADLEWSLYDEIRKEIVGASQSYLSLAHEIAQLDVLSSLAWLAIEQNYTRPTFNESGHLQLVGSRHPVVEQEMGGTFIPNNIRLESEQCLLLTGPNMAGKSTLMRQVAVIAMLAQMGSFVPCEKAEMPLFDQIFTRIGASDHLSEGLSTFMVEMTETAEILKNCTSASLVILDEVGRGTSTFDGLSLAQSILEHLVTHTKALTLFATHYHELTELEGHYSNLVNAHMAVSEQGGSVQFLHTLIAGPALKSYGIYVGELAGLPSAVVRRAKSLLKQVEAQKVTVNAQLSFFDYEPEVAPQKELDSSAGESPAAASASPGAPMATTPEALGSGLEAPGARPAAQLPRLNAVEAPIIDDIKDVNLNDLTPLKALNMISSWQKRLVTPTLGLEAESEY